MDVLELVDEARPDVPPIPQAARQRIRERLFDTGARPEHAVGVQPEPVSPRVRRRARQVVSGFVVLLVVTAAAYAVTRSLDSESEDPAAVASTVPIDRDTTTAAPTSTTPSRNVRLPVRFAPLLPATPPGYELLWARYDGTSRRDNVGLARYLTPGSSAELQIVLRPDPDLFRGPAPDGTRTWRVDGRRVRAGGDGTCGGSTCSIDVQWNDRTALSLSWIDHTGAPLPDRATHDSLIELLGTLRRRPAAWESGPIDPAAASFDTPSAKHAALLMPPDTAEIVDASQRPGWPGTQSAVFLAPDGTVIGVQEGDGPQLPLDLDDARTVRGLTIAPLEADGDAPVYGIEMTCGFARIHDEDGQEPDRAEITELARSTSIDRGSIEISPPEGWTVIDEGPGADVFETQFTVGMLGEDTVLTMVQSPGGSVASLVYGGRSFTPTRFAGKRAWLHRSADGTDVSVVARRGDTAFELGGEGVSADDLAAVLGALVPETTAGWVDRFGPLETVELDTDSCPQQPSLAVESD